MLLVDIGGDGYNILGWTWVTWLLFVLLLEKAHLALTTLTNSCFAKR